MIHIVEATIEDLPTITSIARKTWPIAYGEILSEAQLEYMLNSFYSEEALKTNIASGHEFILAKEDDFVLGFASLENNYQKTAKTKIHKIYMLPESQGKGIGKLLVENIKKRAIAKGSKNLLLNVNRFNKAIGFYHKMGFRIIQEIDIEIGLGYLMEDYVMEKEI